MRPAKAGVLVLALRVSKFSGFFLAPWLCLSKFVPSFKQAGASSQHTPSSCEQRQPAKTLQIPDPPLGYVGTDKVSYVVADGKGGSALGDLLVTVRQNQAPQAMDDSAATDDRTAIVVAILDNDSDPDGDVLRVLSASAEHGSVSIEADQRLRYVPKAGFQGVDVVTYQTGDALGAVASAKLRVQVTPPPTIDVATGKGGGSSHTGLLLVLFMLYCGRLAATKRIRLCP